MIVNVTCHSNKEIVMLCYVMLCYVMTILYSLPAWHQPTESYVWNWCWPTGKTRYFSMCVFLCVISLNVEYHGSLSVQALEKGACNGYKYANLMAVWAHGGSDIIRRTRRTVAVHMTIGTHRNAFNRLSLELNGNHFSDDIIKWGAFCVDWLYWFLMA